MGRKNKEQEPLTEEEMLRRLKAIPNPPLQKIIDKDLEAGVPVAMLYDLIG